MEDKRVEEALSAAAEAGGNGAVDAVTPVLELYRERIERMIRLRMDYRVVGRVGVSDVMQDAYIEVARRLPGYLETLPAEEVAPREPSAPKEPSTKERGPMPFFLWVRFIAGQALQQTHRRHLGTVARDAGRDVPLHSGGRDGVPEASSLMLASALVESGVSPSGFAIREEQREVLADALKSLSAEDREILFLRHFEQLTNREISSILGLTEGGASLRHLRALGRLQRSLSKFGVEFNPETR